MLGKPRGRGFGRFLQELRYTPQLSGGEDHGDFFVVFTVFTVFTITTSCRDIETPKKKIHC